jgi:hypothetical protein
VKKVSSAGVKVRLVRVPPFTGVIVEKPAPLSIFPIVVTIMGLPV